MVTRVDAAQVRIDDLIRLVHDVEDPELPHVTIGDLGMVRNVLVHGSHAYITVTPTYTGCPATEQIHDDIAAAVIAAGFHPVIDVAMSPAWTTDWITSRGRQRLVDAGIAPPVDSTAGTAGAADFVECPRCGSRRTRSVTFFGSTACKASYTCQACLEPFDHFKAI